MTRIRILYFDGCPNHPPVVAMAQRIVAQHGLNADIEEVEVAPDDVVRHRFLGSPTVQVDGVDIEPAARFRGRTDFAMSCRVYSTPDGLPSDEMLLRALRLDGPMTRASRSDRAGMLATGGSVATAILSSACCWLPLLLLTFGASAAGASAFFERWRPAFIVVAVASLALGFYFSCFRNATCADGCCAEQPRRNRRSRRLQRTTLWVSAVIVAVFIFFPSVVRLLLDEGNSAAATNTAGLLDADAREYMFDVEGMHCAGCAVILQNGLVKLDGVVDVAVDYESGTARLRATGDGVAAGVVDAASSLGYSATPQRDEPPEPPDGDSP